MGGATVFGFSDISQNGQRAECMQFADVNIQPHESITIRVAQDKDKLYDQTLCTEAPNGKGSCVRKLRVEKAS